MATAEMVSNSEECDLCHVKEFCTIINVKPIPILKMCSSGSNVV